MTQFRRWHLALIPIPVVGWLLLAAYLLDEAGDARARPVACVVDASPRRRLVAGLIDLGLASCAWWLLPPAPAWLIASAYLLFRDAGARPFGVGKRLLGIGFRYPDGTPLSRRYGYSHSYTSSFERNLSLLVPYVGPLVEAVLTARLGWRLGDRLAEREVRS